MLNLKIFKCMENVERIYCCDRDDNNALAAAILANKPRENNDALYTLLAQQRNSDPMATAAMMNGGMGGQWNNPFIYLVWMMFAQRMWGNGCMDGNGNCNNPQIAALQNQMQDNQNASLLMDGIKGVSGSIQQLAQNLNCDFNTLNSCCCDLRQAIAQVSGQVGFSAERVINAVNMGDCNVIQAIKDCCCTTQRQLGDLRADIQLQVCQQTGELRNGQRDLGVAISQGFASAAYETQKQTCEIINNQNANTQRIVDTLNSHWRDELQLQNQDLKTKISQLEQTQQILAALNAPKTTTTA